MAALLGAAACSGGSIPVEPSRAVLGAPESVQALESVDAAVRGAVAGTASFRIALTGATILGPGATDAGGEGVFDFPAGRGTLQLTPAGDAGAESVIYGPAAIYVHQRVPPGFLPPGKTWLGVGFADPAALARNFPHLIAQTEAVNPGFALGELAWGGVAAARLGRDLRAAPRLTAYDVRVDLRAALAHATGPARVPMSLAIREGIIALTGGAATGSAAAEARVRAWLGDRGELVALELDPPGAGAGVVTVTLGGAGTPVRADPPPAAEVADVLTVTPFGERENQNGGDSDGA